MKDIPFKICLIVLMHNNCKNKLEKMCINRILCTDTNYLINFTPRVNDARKYSY